MNSLPFGDYLNYMPKFKGEEVLALGYVRKQILRKKGEV
jgi:hypothetical protein